MNFVQVVYVIGMDMVQVRVNGIFEYIKENIILTDFLKSKKLPLVFAVEINKNIIKKEDYEKVILNDGDNIEIVAFCSGG